MTFTTLSLPETIAHTQQKAHVLPTVADCCTFTCAQPTIISHRFLMLFSLIHFDRRSLANNRSKIGIEPRQSTRTPMAFKFGRKFILVMLMMTLCGYLRTNLDHMHQSIMHQAYKNRASGGYKT